MAEERPYIPLGFDKNSAAWPQQTTLAVVAFTGCCVSVYLALFQIGTIQGVWNPFFQSPKVLEYLGILDALLERWATVQSSC